MKCVTVLRLCLGALFLSCILLVVKTVQNANKVNTVEQPGEFKNLQKIKQLNDIEALNNFKLPNTNKRSILSPDKEELFSFEVVDRNDNPLKSEQRPRLKYQKIVNSARQTRKRNMTVNVATVACGNLQLAINMLKTAILFSQDVNLHVVIFTGQETIPQVKLNMVPLIKEEAKNYLGSDFTYEIHQVSFPATDDGIDWRRMYADCTNQRLFFPSRLQHIDSLIYLDTDTLVMGNLSNFWAEFSKMSEFQLLAAAQNQEFLHDASIYNPSKGHLYFGPRGLNAGVLLMNLTRMRAFQFEKKAVQAFRTHKSKITLADQDILNILFNAYPQFIMSLSCIYNFYWIHCPFKSFENRGKKMCRWWNDEEPVCFCHDIYKRGLYIIHGNYGSFFQPPDNSGKSMFPWIYKIWHEYRFGDSLDELLLKIGLQYKKYECFMSGRDLIENAQNYLINLNMLK